ncbi:KGK domain-containing protein [Coleofasciculus sp. FACHB-542]|uniref:KGK domain-containing protein n=1 Tax=Coleofasciculus sp. FACHB-542 TaxID=2692787 RepID=UPI00168535DD|nr:KGK domain-containing protein [Coleofasciculus sp. FACHB-542]MBD2085009.1 KGK domain-containing protein [Coleofasciculus sp. FACHB-542]
MNNGFERIEADNVLCVNTNTQRLLIQHPTFQVGEFINKMQAQVGATGEQIKWFSEGIDCKVLKPGANWKQGKVRVSLEFCPDEPESPLEDIRQQLKEDDS